MVKDYYVYEKRELYRLSDRKYQELLTAIATQGTGEVGLCQLGELVADDLAGMHELEEMIEESLATTEEQHEPE